MRTVQILQDTVASPLEICPATLIISPRFELLARKGHFVAHTRRQSLRGRRPLLGRPRVHSADSQAHAFWAWESACGAGGATDAAAGAPEDTPSQARRNSSKPIFTSSSAGSCTRQWPRPKRNTGREKDVKLKASSSYTSARRPPPAFPPREEESFPKPTNTSCRQL